MTTTPRPRVLIFGIDAATPDLVQKWTARGDLPTLARLIRHGVFGTLQSVPNMMTPAAWSSFATGCNPAKHGILYFTERVPGSYAERFIKGAARVLPSFWSMLSERGFRSNVINVPMTFPADPVNGVMISGLDAPSLDTPGAIHPSELGGELRLRYRSLFAPRVFSGGIGHLVLAGRFEDALTLLEQQVHSRTALVCELLERYPADACILVHTEVDSVQHYFWKFIDPRMPGHSTRLAQRYGDSILRIYQAVDRSLEMLCHAYHPTQVLVLSDHGAGASPGGSDGVPWIRRVLEELGLCVPALESNRILAAMTRTRHAFYRAMNPRLPPPVRRLARRWMPGALDAVKAGMKYRPDWSRTMAFCSGAAGDVWINLKGRDPEGIVEPGEEYERLRQHIRDAFLALRETASGEPVVEAVHFREDVYSGPYVDRAPDLIIRLRDVVIRGLMLHGREVRPPAQAFASPKEIKSGSHRPEGIVVLQGEGVATGQTVTGAHLVDVAPTILYWMGQPVPTYIDGRVLTQAFLPHYLGTHPVEYDGVRLKETATKEASYTAEEEAVLTERLRRLGYV